MEEENKEAVLPTAEEETKKVMHKGTVVWFNYKTGYGYIKPDDPSINDGKDLFVHYKGISDDLAVIKEGKPPFKKLLRDQRVIFELGTNSKGYVAENVNKEPISESNETSESEETPAEAEEAPVEEPTEEANTEAPAEAEEEVTTEPEEAPAEEPTEEANTEAPAEAEEVSAE